MSERMSIEQAAKLLGISQQAVRIGLQIGKFPFGVAIPSQNPKNPKKPYHAYYIFKNRFEEYTGIKVQMEEQETSNSNNEE